MNPAVRRKVAAIHLAATIPLMVLSVVLFAHTGYERILMGISWYAISVTAVDVLATTDVREKEHTE
jgi:hypothetical protein